MKNIQKFLCALLCATCVVATVSGMVDPFFETRLEIRSEGGKSLRLRGYSPKLIEEILPLYVGMEKEIKEIDLTASQLKKLPSGIFKFTALEDLGLCKNSGCSITGILQLSRLKVLRISCNGYSVLPDAIFNHSGLEKLEVYNNHLNLDETLEQVIRHGFSMTGYKVDVYNGRIFPLFTSGRRGFPLNSCSLLFERGSQVLEIACLCSQVRLREND
jgi:hypothetical protein